jgi:hypothetical protein
MQKLLRFALLAVPLPFILYTIYGVLRLCHIQPPQELGMSEFITTGWFIMGSSICYFTAIVLGLRSKTSDYLRWLAPAVFLFFLGVDESFRIHENLQDFFLVSGKVVFGVYGLILLGILFLFRKSTRFFWVGVALFFLFCGSAVFTDQYYGEGALYVHEGTIYLDRDKIPGGVIRDKPCAKLDFEVDYEQIFESLGALFLSCGFAAAAALALDRRPADPSVSLATSTRSKNQGKPSLHGSEAV